MKTLFILVLIILSSSVYGQTRAERRAERKADRAARKESRHVYRVHPLKGVSYPKGTVKPSTVKWILVTVFIGVAAGRVMYEETNFLNDKSK